MPPEDNPIDDRLETSFTDAADDNTSAEQTSETPQQPAEQPAPTPPQEATPSQPAADLQQELEELRSQVERLTPLAEYGQQIMPYAEDIRDYFGQKLQQPQPSEQPQGQPEEQGWNEDEYFNGLWKSANWDPQFDILVQNNLVRQNPQTGLWEPERGSELVAGAAVNKMNEAEQLRRQQWGEITQGANPYHTFYQKLMPAIENKILSQVQELVGRQFAEKQVDSDMRSFEEKNAGWMYQEKDGKRELTDSGKTFLDNVRSLTEDGMQDPDRIIATAMKMTKADHGDFTQQQQKPAAQASAGNSQQQSSFLEDSLKRAQHSPSGGAGVIQSPDTPVSIESESELNSMFEQALRASQS